MAVLLQCIVPIVLILILYHKDYTLYISEFVSSIFQAFELYNNAVKTHFPLHCHYKDVYLLHSLSEETLNRGPVSV